MRTESHPSKRLILLSCLLLALGAAGLRGSAAQAAVEGPGWELVATSYPTNFLHGVDEVQEITVNTGEPMFTLTFQNETTSAISATASAAEVRSALEMLPIIGNGNVAVTGAAGHYVVTFVETLGSTKVAELEAVGASVSVSTVGAASGTIGIDIFNIGAGATRGTIAITDTLPPGIKAKEAGEIKTLGPFGNGFGVDPRFFTHTWNCTGNGPGAAPKVAGATIVTCTNDPVGLPVFAGGGGTPANTETANPQPRLGITVEGVTEVSGLINHVSIAGGGAPAPASTVDPVTVSSQPAHGGLTQADAWFSNADGTIDTQAGSHPYTATFVFDTATATNAVTRYPYIPGSEIRTLETRTPPGFVGNLADMPTCTRAQLTQEVCPPSSMVGTLYVDGIIGIPATHHVFNMIPASGTPAELGFNFGGIPVYFEFKVRSGGDYGITTLVNNIAQREIDQSVLTLWGVPQEHSHDRWRAGREGGCTEEEIKDPRLGTDSVEYCAEQQDPVMRPFLTLPTACGEAQPYSFHELSGWQEADIDTEVPFLSHDASGKPVGFSGCEALGFEPAITTAPDTAKADTPTGLTVEVRPPVGGLETPGLRSTSDIKDTVVQLPAGLVINPGQAAGLQACGPTEDGLTTEAERARGEENDGPAHCLGASKVGTVVIKSPLIESNEEKQFEGSVYVLQSDPPELKLLVAASADGVNIKLVGDVSLCEAVGEVLDGKTCQAPGQLIAAFDNTPELPFTVFSLSFSGGAQAALDTPAQCGTYTADADFTPWSTPFLPDHLTSSSFTLTEGPDGTACPSNPMPFAPSLIAGATTDQAGGYTAFSMLLQRADGQQRIEKLSFKIPQGLAGMISSVPLCGEPQAAQGTCPASSHVGHAVVTSGPGPYPLVIPQPGEPEAPIYLTGPYKGAPFGLSIVTPVIAGPFNLGTIVTRAKIEVDPHTAQITVTTDPLPQIVKGVPTDLREVQAVIDRPGFMFNPTNCDPQSFSGTATSAEGASVGISSPFGMGSCQSLKFAPKFQASTGNKTSRANGAGLTAKLSYPAGSQGTQANIARVKVELPKQLPSRLTTLQKACTAAQFEANPGGCPAASVIGHATVHTAVLSDPLAGPVYFVSHGGEAFPSLTIVLQGDGVTVDLVGATFISKQGITSTTFKTVPDVPFSSFELTLPQGPYSALTANLPTSARGSLCAAKLVMPIEMIAQNGLQIHQNIKIAATGCSKAKARKKTTRRRKSAKHQVKEQHKRK